MSILIVPKITLISNEIRMARNNTPFAQQIATMDDGSIWEVPCVGNGSLWRKVGKSHAELQEDFRLYFLAISEGAPQNKTNGTATNRNREAKA